VSWITSSDLEAAAVRAGLVTAGQYNAAFYNAIIDASVAEFESMVGFKIVVTAETTKTRKFVDPVRIVDIAGFAHTITEVKLDGVVLTDLDYVLRPEDGPYSYIELVGRAEGAFEIKGNFGYSSTAPADLKSALTGYGMAKVALASAPAGTFGGGALVEERLGEVVYKYSDTDANTERVSWVADWAKAINRYRRVAVC
jgi:hypothetical protein